MMELEALRKRVAELEAELEEAKDALWQCVDDFKEGLNVCRATWWQAREFFEKYTDGDYPIDPTAHPRCNNAEELPTDREQENK